MALDLSFGDIAPAEPIPEGFYEVTVDDIGVEDSKATPGNKNLVVTLRVTGPDQIAEEVIGRKVKEVISLAHSARWKLQLVLEALTGIPWRDDNMALDPRDLMGMQAKIVVFHNAGKDGRTFANVKSWHSFTESE